MCWNIANPSQQRALHQATWLLENPADVLVLTECKRSRGCELLANFFSAHGHEVIFPRPLDNEYGVLLASKHNLKLSDFSKQIQYLNSRVVSVMIPSIMGGLEIIGVYVPSRGFDTGTRAKKKSQFMRNLYHALASRSYRPRVFCGDLNVLEPDHIPNYRHFQDWEPGFYRNIQKCHLTDAFRFLYPTAQEYSWVGRSGDGYRYDHCFVSEDLLPLIRDCSYAHQTRALGLSDHSVLSLELAS